MSSTTESPTASPTVLPTILIVDDDPTLRKAIAFDFKRKGYRVLEAENGMLAFVSGSEIKYNIFAKIAENKYVKIAHVGEDLSRDRILNYKKKGILFLYLLRDDFERYMRFNLDLAHVVRPNLKIQKDGKIRLLKHTSKIIVQHLYKEELNSESLDAAKAVVETAIDYLAEIPAGLELLEALNNHADFLYAHSVGVSICSCMVAKHLQWLSPKTMYRIAIGGMLHDIGKKDLPRELLEKPKHLMSAEEVRLYESHPKRGVDILSHLPEIPSDIIQIAIQHHERDCGSGYPAGLKKGKIQPLAKLIGIVDEFCYWTIKGPDSPGISPKEAVSKLLATFNSPVDGTFIDALRAVWKFPPDKLTG